jgi:hypothetical protein
MGYPDHVLCARWTEKWAFFVKRQKGNADYLVVEDKHYSHDRKILKEQIILSMGTSQRRNALIL